MTISFQSNGNMNTEAPYIAMGSGERGVAYSSRFSSCLPQCGAFCDAVDSLTTFRFSARRTPILASIVGPPRVATSIRADRGLPLRCRMLGFRKLLVM